MALRILFAIGVWAAGAREADLHGAQDPGAGAAWFARGESLLALDHRRFDARRAFERAVAAQPDSLAWWYRLARLNLELGGLDAEDRARAAFREIFRREPLYRDAFELWSRLYLDRSDSRGVAETLAGRLRERPDAEVALRRIDLLADAGEHRAALAAIAALDAAARAHASSRLARIEAAVRSALGEDELGWARYRSGIAAAARAEDLDPYHADVEPLLPAGDLEAWPAWSLARRRVFLEGWWNERDPLPATALNERWVEQMRRLRFVRRTFQFKKAWDLEGLVGLGGEGLGLPTLATRLDGRPVDDRAVIYLRHGDPDWRGGVGRDECGYWWYRRPGLPGGSFAINFRSGGDFRERSRFLVGDCVYSSLPTTEVGHGHFAPGGLEPWDVPRIRRETAAELSVALSSDSYPYPFERTLPVDVDPASFALAAGAAEAAIYFAVPLDAIGTEGGRARYRKSLVVYDDNWREVARSSEEMEVAISAEGPAGGRAEPGRDPAIVETAFLLDLFRVRLEPGSYRVALQLDDRASGGVGVWRGAVAVPAFGSGLALSDVVLAFEARPGLSPPRFVRHGHVVRPLPSRVFEGGQPLFLYYEVYGLQADASGGAEFRVDYTVRSERLDGSAIRRLFGALGNLVGVRDTEEAITLSFERRVETARSPWPEYLSLDTSALEPGEYALEVAVTGAGGRAATRTETFTIVD